MDSNFVDSLEEEFERRDGKGVKIRARFAQDRDGFAGRKNPHSARERRRRVRRLHPY